MSSSDRGQVNASPAEIYEQFFVPAIFQEWTSRVADAAHIRAGQRVLDVACGTGILARTVYERVGASGSVVGLDVKKEMLAVAARKAPYIEWRHGTAESLPFDDASFDAVVSQFGLMFFADQVSALREMYRVLRPGGHLAVAVWDTLDRTPGYAEMTDLLLRFFGEEAATEMRAPFVLGDTQQLQPLFTEAGIPNATITTIVGTTRFPSIRAWVLTDIKDWVLADEFDDTQFNLLLNEAEHILSPFVVADGSVSLASPAHIVAAVKP